MTRFRTQPGREIQRKSALNLAALTIITMTLFACGAAGPRPLSITMFHPEKKTSLECKARDFGLADPNMLADSVENCARQLEKAGFVRQSGEPSAATRP
jgi:hypothetical protein